MHRQAVAELEAVIERKEGSDRNHASWQPPDIVLMHILILPVFTYCVFSLGV